MSQPAPASLDEDEHGRGRTSAAAPVRARRAWTAAALTTLPPWIVLVWLARRGADVAPDAALPGIVLAAALLAAVATAWLWPGLLLWRLVRDDDHDVFDALAFAAALGLAWLLVPVSATLLLGGDMDRLVMAVVVLNGLLGVACGVLSATRPPRGARPGRRIGRSRSRSSSSPRRWSWCRRAIPGSRGEGTSGS